MRRKVLGVGILLELLGVIGFIVPSPVFGFFEVNTGLNLAHIASGTLAIWSAVRGIGSMRACGKLLGFAYLALAIIGFAAPDYDLFRYVSFGTPDNWLHLGISIAFMYFAYLSPPN